MRVAMVVDEDCVRQSRAGRWLLTERHERRIEASLKRLGYTVVVVTVRGDLEVLVADLSQARPAVVFNLTEGFRNERRHDGFVADFMSMAGFRVTGNSGRCLQLCRDKAISKMILSGSGISVPRFLTVYNRSSLRAARFASIPYPVIVKPLALDGSDLISRTSLCRDSSRAMQRAEWLLAARSEPVIVEEYVRGRELAIPFTAFRAVRLYPPRELQIPSKYSLDPIATSAIKDRRENRRPQPQFGPARLGTSELSSLRRLVRTATSALGISSYARIDLVITPDGTPVVLEVNANCGLAPRAFGLSVRNGYDRYDALIRGIVQGAVRNKP
jgi:D-alanine-D-alanine ligase